MNSFVAIQAYADGEIEVREFDTADERNHYVEHASLFTRWLENGGEWATEGSLRMLCSRCWPGPVSSADRPPTASGVAFSAWAHEVAGAPPDVIEVCLAHKIPGVRGKYNHALYLPQRRELLEKWSQQCENWGLRLP